VRFVDHDQFALRVERGPAVVSLEVLIQSGKIRDDDVRLLADAGLLLAFRVAVVDADRDVQSERIEEIVEFPLLVAAERLRRIDEQRAHVRILPKTSRDV